MIEQEKRAVWNIDDEILKIIKIMKESFLTNLLAWDLEQSYWILLLILAECDAKIKENERKEINEKIKELETVRRNYLKEKNSSNAGKFYKNLIELYKKMNLLMKEHGVWFREMEDDVGL